MGQAMKIAIVDDEVDMRESIGQWLALAGYDAQIYASARDALKQIDANYPGIVITDLKMPEIDGMQFLKKLLAQDSSLPVIMITGHGDVPMAVEAMRLGAFDFLEKPFDPQRLSALAKKASASRRVTLDNRQLRRELSDTTQLSKKLIGKSKPMNKLREDILDFGLSDGPVLISGETGTGKTLVAHALHAVGNRAGKACILMSCSAFDEASLARRLFGPILPEDDFLPAVELARGGSLILEDFHVLGAVAQSQLLNFLNKQGDPADVKIIAISNLQAVGQSLRDCMRKDLFYRFDALQMTLPPLRQRGDDILLMFNQFCCDFADEYGSEIRGLKPQEAAQILQAPWPGNVRQLINVAEQAVLQWRSGEGNISALLLDENEDASSVVTTEGKPLKEYVEAFEKMLIDNTMRRHRGSVSKVMEELSLPRRTLNEKMAKYKLQRSSYL